VHIAKKWRVEKRKTAMVVPNKYSIKYAMIYSFIVKLHCFMNTDCFRVNECCIRVFLKKSRKGKREGKPGSVYTL